jgi:hypothetical protein
VLGEHGAEGDAEVDREGRATTQGAGDKPGPRPNQDHLSHIAKVSWKIEFSLEAKSL